MVGCAIRSSIEECLWVWGGGLKPNRPNRQYSIKPSVAALLIIVRAFQMCSSLVSEFGLMRAEVLFIVASEVQVRAELHRALPLRGSGARGDAEHDR